MSEPTLDEGRPPEPEAIGIPDPNQVEVPTALRREIEQAMRRYPEKRSASIPALWAVQRRYGWCTPEGIEQAATVLGLTPAHLESVASFYDLFHLEPQGAHKVLVCTNISCWLRGGDEMLDAFCAASGAKPGESSEDGSVYVSGFECLGGCDLAPMASIDERYFGPLAPPDAELAVEQLRAGEDVLPEKGLELRGAAGGKTAPADERLTRHRLNKKMTPRRKSASGRAATRAGGRS